MKMKRFAEISYIDGAIYDVAYDLDKKRFIIYNEKGNGIHFTREDLIKYIEKGEISIIKDKNRIFEKYLK